MKIAIAGGDRRSIIMGEMLSDVGYQVSGFGFEEAKCNFETLKDLNQVLKNAKAVILPLPYERDGVLNAPFSNSKTPISSILEACGSEALILGGKLPPYRENIVDYSKREEFMLKNAVPSAEGALEIALKETDITIFGSSCVISGYGRIGKYLSRVLKALGANTTIIARSLESRTQAEIEGHHAVGFENCEAPLSHAHIVFNTVPFKVFREKELLALKQNTVLIDLASFPYGANKEECERFGVKLIRALSLPPKIAPKTAGEILFQTIYAILFERGLTP